MSSTSLTILGSTGSIGQSTLDVVRQHPERYQIFALVGGSNCAQMIADAQEFKPSKIVMATSAAAEEVEVALSDDVDVSFGVEAMESVSADERVDAVMAAIVGAAGLLPSIAAARAGKKVLLANKESLVVAGKLFMDAAKASGAVVLPIDSEHNAIFQCLPDGQVDRQKGGVSKILLTGSGGPFRGRPLDSFNDITVAQAVAHPNWSMGRKISVDSATMMNKGLEFIEACWLFDVEPSEIEVVLHPESIIHSMVQYVDGSVLAQMGNPDMRTPIAYGMSWPERISAGVQPLDFSKVSQLNFQKPDFDRYPCLKLAVDAMSVGGSAPAILNAANEVAVDAFLNERIRFTDIAEVNAATVAQLEAEQVISIEQILAVDTRARAVAEQEVTKRAK